MADMTLAVKITGDASSLSGAVDSAKAKIDSLHNSINNKNGTAGLDAIGSKVQAVGDKVTKFGKTYTASVTTPIVAGSAVAVKKFAEVDKTMQLTNATMGNSAADAEKLEKAMKEAASNSTFGMNEAATASLNFARAGLDATEAANSLAPAMNLAAGEGGNLDTVSAGLVATINGFGDSFDQAGKYADVFANACNNSALDIDGLSNAMSVAAPIFSAAGYSVNDAALYMGTMANAGIDASVAANSLKTGMARLISPSKQGAEWMERLNISMTNADGTMKDSVQVQRELHDAFSGLSDSEKVAAASAIFGKNQMSNWLALIETAPDDVSNLSKELEKEGTTAEMADAMMSGFGGSLEKIKSSIDVAATSFGEALAPSIEKVADKIQKAVDWFNKLEPEQQQQIAKIAAIVAAIGPLLLIVGKITSVVGGAIVSMGSLGGAFGGAGASALSLVGSIGKIAGIAGLVITALVGMYQNSESFREAVNNLVGTALKSLMAIFEALKPAFEAVFNALQPLLGALGDALAPIIDLLAKQIELFMPILLTLIDAFVWLVEAISPVIEWIAQLISVLGEGLAVVVDAISEKINAVVEWFKGFGDAASSLKDTISDAWDTIKNVVEVAVMAIGSILEAAFEIITLPYRLIWENCKEYVFAAWEVIKTTVSNALNAIKEKIEIVWNAIKSTVETVWGAIKDKAKEAFNAVYNVVAEPTQKAYDKLKTLWNSARDTLSTGWNNLKGTASRVWNGIKDSITGPIEKAKNAIVRAWEKVKSALETKISIPHIDLPHFRVSGSFSLDPPSVPHLSVDWYAKGGLFSKPSVVGVGEAGPEAVAPIDKLKAYVTEAVTNARSAIMDSTAIDSLADAIATGFAMQNTTQNAGGEYRFIVELGGTRVAEKIYTLNREGEMIMKGI